MASHTIVLLKWPNSLPGDVCTLPSWKKATLYSSGKNPPYLWYQKNRQNSIFLCIFSSIHQAMKYCTHCVLSLIIWTLRLQYLANRHFSIDGQRPTRKKWASNIVCWWRPLILNHGDIKSPNSLMCFLHWAANLTSFTITYIMSWFGFLMWWQQWWIRWFIFARFGYISDRGSGWSGRGGWVGLVWVVGPVWVVGLVWGVSGWFSWKNKYI